MSKAKEIIRNDYNGYTILVRRFFGRTELSVNGTVCDENIGFIENPYILKGKAGDAVITAELRLNFIGGTYFLYADGILLAKKWRLF